MTVDSEAKAPEMPASNSSLRQTLLYGKLRLVMIVHMPLYLTLSCIQNIVGEHDQKQNVQQQGFPRGHPP
jgi:hypothetical protein